MKEKTTTLLKDKTWARWTALVLLALAMFFAYMFVDVLSPLQTALQDTKGWNPTTYGNFAGSETFLNVFIFFLIFAGIILDKMGVRFTAILSGSVMLLGGFLNYFALTDMFVGSGIEKFFDNFMNLPKEWWNVTPFFKGMPASAKMSAVGFMIFGCGVEMAGITVSRGIVKWFAGKEMALAMGVEMALARVGVFAVFLLSPFMAKLGGSIQVSRSIGFVVFLLCIGLISFIVYSFMDKKLEKQAGDLDEKDDPFKVSDLKYIIKSKVFWIVALLCVLYYSAIFPFQKYAANMLQCNLGITDEFASMIFSIFPLGAAAITPFLGRYLDKVGKGATMLIYGSILMIVCHLIFAVGLPAMRGGEMEAISENSIVSGIVIDSQKNEKGKTDTIAVVFSPKNFANKEVVNSLVGTKINSEIKFNPRKAFEDATIINAEERAEASAQSVSSLLKDEKTQIDIVKARTIDRDYNFIVKKVQSPMGTIGFIVAFLAIILLGISFSLVPASLWPSVPKLVEGRLLGSAYAVIFWIQNIGLYAVPIIIGNVIVASNKGVVNPLNYDYTIPMLVFASFGVLALLFSLSLKAMDAKKHYGLELPNIAKSSEAEEAEMQAVEE